MKRGRATDSLLARGDQPLIGVFVQKDGRPAVRYFTEEALADAAVRDTVVSQALAAIGSWSDLDFDETLDALDKLRHESTPTPPIELDL